MYSGAKNVFPILHIKQVFFSSVAPKNKKFDKKLQSQAFDTIFGLIQEGAIFVPPPTG